ncbi:MAG TPA: MbcA/ParS/Xre antitoxin family protein [Elusimicrobiota bacterium]|nr:MbcA/ParS/Xre antitoxin family protein [Elusimicrobiota bacterium]
MIPATSTSHDAKTLSGPALRTFFRIAERWDLDVEEQMALLGLAARSTFFKWKKQGAVLPKDVLERISYVLGIYKALQILLPNPDAADAWIRQPNAAGPFGGRPALTRMVQGVGDLYAVRQYLDAQRSGWA